MSIPRVDRCDCDGIVISGQAYSADVIIYPDHIDDKWWRAEGHSLAPEDLAEVFQQPPEVLVIGQGNEGRMVVPEETLRQLKAAGIDVIVELTEQACETYNRLCEQKRVVAALHLAC